MKTSPLFLGSHLACLFCLPLYPTPVLTAPFYVQQSSGSCVCSARQRKALEPNKQTATVMIVTPLKCDCVPKLDWTAAAAAAAQTHDEGSPLLHTVKQSQ